jgi:hypothetical protein
MTHLFGSDSFGYLATCRCQLVARHEIECGKSREKSTLSLQYAHRDVCIYLVRFERLIDSADTIPFVAHGDACLPPGSIEVLSVEARMTTHFSVSGPETSGKAPSYKR